MAAAGRTAAFSFTGILAFAAVVTGLATAFAFTGVLSLCRNERPSWPSSAICLSEVPSLAREELAACALDGERDQLIKPAIAAPARMDVGFICCFSVCLFTRTGNSSRMIRAPAQAKEYGRTGRADADKATCGNRKND